MHASETYRARCGCSVFSLDSCKAAILGVRQIFRVDTLTCLPPSHGRAPQTALQWCGRCVARLAFRNIRSGRKGVFRYLDQRQISAVFTRTEFDISNP